MNSICRGFLSLILALCFAAPAGAAESQGTFEVRIKDHREAIDDFSQLILTVGELLIGPKPGLMFWQSGWKGLAPARESIDLTKYVGENSVRIFRGSLNPGAFDAIHLKLKEVSGLLRKGQRSIKIKNTVGPIKLSFEIRPPGRNDNRLGFSRPRYVRSSARRLRTRHQRLRGLYKRQTRRQSPAGSVSNRPRKAAGSLFIFVPKSPLGQVSGS